jgi:hypothetical protein
MYMYQLLSAGRGVNSRSAVFLNGLRNHDGGTCSEYTCITFSLTSGPAACTHAQQMNPYGGLPTQQQAAEQQQKAQQQEEMRQELLKKILSPEALTRLGTLAVAKPEKVPARFKFLVPVHTLVAPLAHVFFFFFFFFRGCASGSAAGGDGADDGAKGSGQGADYRRAIQANARGDERG